MNNGFIFNKIRCSVSKGNQIILQGYCSRDYMENACIEAFLSNDAACLERLETSWIMTEATLEDTVKLHEQNLTHIITIMIDIPKSFSGDNVKLVVTRSKAEDKNAINRNDCVLYTCSGLKIIKCLQRINYSVDSVELEGNYIRVRGWAIDSKEISVRLTQILKEKTEDVDFNIVWNERPDVMRWFVECQESVKIGFEICIAKTKLGMRLTLSSADRSGTYRIKAIKTYSKINAVNKVNRYWYKGLYTLNNYGVEGAVSKVKRRFRNKKSISMLDYAKWVDGRNPASHEMKQQKLSCFEYEPYFDIVIENRNTNIDKSSEFEDSIKCQTYTKWQFDNKNKSVNDAEYVVFGDNDARLTGDALYECAKIINRERPDVIYCDEDTTYIEDGIMVSANPKFKPDFNIDLLRSCNYIGRVLAISKEFLKKKGDMDVASYDFILRCAENTDKISHISKILYRNGKATDVSEKLEDNCIHTVKNHLDRMGILASVEEGDIPNTCTVSYEVQGNPLVSIIIPNKDHVADLKRCMGSIDNKSEYRNYEYIIVENNSVEPETFEFYKEISKRDDVTILYWDGGFNYSAINNYGADFARGEYLLLLNNDTEIINGDCLSQMLGYCQRDDVGIVGARLYYEDGTVQHAGVVIGLGGIAGNIFAGSDESEGTYMSRTKVCSDYSAVTAACLMVKRSLYEIIDGLDEEFEVAFNDVDFCLRVRQMNKLVVYNANAKLFHYESKSRGAENTLQKQDRFNDEIELFNEKWGDILREGDPYYNPNLTLDKPDFSLRLD